MRSTEAKRRSPPARKRDRTRRLGHTRHPRQRQYSRQRMTPHPHPIPGNPTKDPESPTQHDTVKVSFPRFHFHISFHPAASWGRTRCF
ncbi:hypothetical protein CALVIDRAFT_86323 [Calocera viscosa TUFC12733]|uniref:Uncharacterized protein n=1 Tax=Calocera viscosa (strain TUFC12733) TaxID=1330018 RepID=A0A167N5B9_CALVF|nr:hypothetical protein CALVIDRAFT_86323 [Calocera viscosa TUFC12733]